MIVLNSQKTPGWQVERKNTLNNMSMLIRDDIIYIFPRESRSIAGFFLNGVYNGSPIKICRQEI